MTFTPTASGRRVARNLDRVGFESAHASDLIAVLAGRRMAVLTGAGVSTDSGIPDYRGPKSPPSRPMTIGQFRGDPVFRQRYWARNHLGWRHLAATDPNAGHRALAVLEQRGLVAGIITQNVDLLHTKAGSTTVINLHGTYSRVVCLRCGRAMTRQALATRLGHSTQASSSARKASAGSRWPPTPTPTPSSPTPTRFAT